VGVGLLTSKHSHFRIDQRLSAKEKLLASPHPVQPESLAHLISIS